MFWDENEKLETADLEILGFERPIYSGSNFNFTGFLFRYLIGFYHVGQTINVRDHVLGLSVEKTFLCSTKIWAVCDLELISNMAR